MARSDSFHFFAFLLIAGGVALLSVARADYEDSPAPAPMAETYVVRCATKLTEECGDRIFNNIFLKQGELTPECCKKLVLVGIKCHETMVNYMISVPELSKNASITVPRSKQVWNQCVLLAEGAPSPA